MMFLFSDSKSLIPWTDWHPVFIIKMITGWKTVSGFCQQSRCFACCACHGFWLVPSLPDTGLWLAGAGIVMFWGVLHDATCFVYMTEAAWHTGINDSSRGGFWQIINPRIKIINPPLTWWHPLWNFIRVGAMVGFFSWRSTSPASCLIVLNWNRTSLSSSIRLCRIPIRTWKHQITINNWSSK